MDPVTIRRESDCAVVTIDNPPVNAASAAVRAGLVRAIDETEADAKIRAVVLICAGRTFVAGADISEFGRTPAPPALADVVLALEAAGKPWVAAIHGTALGGGLEVALGCGYRIAAGDARLGLPEVGLGLIPGAGGTVRLARLVAPREAVVLLAGGKPVRAQRALELGLIDAVAEGELLPAALRLAERAAARPRPVPLAARMPAGEPDEAFEVAARRIVSGARGQVAPVEAVAALRDALALPAAEAFAAERRRFTLLRDGEQSPALRHAFSAERAVSKVPGLENAKLQPTDTVGVIGGGTMGAGIAAATLLSGRSVIMVERDTARLERGLDAARRHLDGSLKRGVIDADGHARHVARLSGSVGYAAIGGADLVIEAVFEDMEVKRAVFAELDRATRADAILATNTSYLDVNEIAASVSDPGRVVGLHFFSPAHVMKLVEVIRTEAVRKDVLATVLGFARSLGKIAVPTGVCDGFVGNRILTRYRQACDIMLIEGALPWQIDAAMREFGMAMGPYEVQDLSGLDIAYANRRRLGWRTKEGVRYVPIADRIVEETGRLGRKTGAGWYDYDGTAAPSPVVEAIVVEESSRAGLGRRGFDDTEIVERATTAMIEEGVRILEEGIAGQAAAIDVVMIHGYAFPRWRGGPLYYAERIGLAEVLRRIATYAAADPLSWGVPRLLRRAVETGQRLDDLAR
ncbi:MAG: 3-hydroxyacyl-CoA dehydrogenase NAD-binding domain-containing protein [Amaricoccus sp.]